MAALSAIFLILVFTGVVIIGIAATFRTQYYQSPLKFNPVAWYRVWERKREFRGAGFQLHVIGVLLVTVGTFVIAIRSIFWLLGI